MNNLVRTAGDRSMRWLARGVTALAVSGLAHGPAAGQLRDVGAFGPACPVTGAEAPEWANVRLSLPERPPEGVRVATRLEFAPGLRRERVLRSTPPWPVGAPATFAFVGTDPPSLQVVRGLPPGSGVYVVSMSGWQDVRTVQALCPTCLVQPGSDATAALFGVTRYPALVRWTGREVVVVEGP